MTYYIEWVHSVRVNEKEWTRQWPDVTFVDVDLEYIDDNGELIRDILTMDISDWWIIEEYGYFCE